MTLDEIRAGIDRYSLAVVADKIGHAHSSIWRIVTGKTKRPSHEIVAKLEAFLQDQEKTLKGRK